MVFVNRQIEQPIYQKVGIARQEISFALQAAAQEIEHAEVVEIAHELTDEHGRRRKHDERQRDFYKLRPRARAVYPRRLVQVGIEVGKYARCEQHARRNGQPAVDKPADKSRAPLGVDAQKQLARAAEKLYIIIDRTLVGEHELERQQRYEPRHGVREHWERAPQLFALDDFFVEQQRNAKPAEIVERRRHNRPEYVPNEYLAERSAHAAHAENLDEVGEPDPAHERARLRDIAAVIGKRQEYHKYDRQNVEHEHADHWQHQRRHVEIFIEHARHGLLELRRGVAARHVVVRALRVAYVRQMHRYKESRKYEREYAEQHHYDRVVALDAHAHKPHRRFDGLGRVLYVLAASGDARRYASEPPPYTSEYPHEAAPEIPEPIRSARL